jgi:DNA repair ATPase RecN
MYISATNISIIVVALGVIIAFLGYRKGSISDMKKETRENAILCTKVDNVMVGVTNIQNKQATQDLKFDTFGERLTRVETRLDNIEYIKRKEVV